MFIILISFFIFRMDDDTLPNPWDVENLDDFLQYSNVK